MVPLAHPPPMKVPAMRALPLDQVDRAPVPLPTASARGLSPPETRDFTSLPVTRPMEELPEAHHQA